MTHFGYGETFKSLFQSASIGKQYHCRSYFEFSLLICCAIGALECFVRFRILYFVGTFILTVGENI